MKGRSCVIVVASVESISSYKAFKLWCNCKLSTDLLQVDCQNFVSTGSQVCNNLQITNYNGKINSVFRCVVRIEQNVRTEFNTILLNQPRSESVEHMAGMSNFCSLVTCLLQNCKTVM